MTEYDSVSAERLARSAIADYSELGPEPGFGQVETEALTEWIEAARRGRQGLSATEKTHFGWMYVDRCWSRVIENGELTTGLAPDTKAANAADLEAARLLFQQAYRPADNLLRGHIDAALKSLPVVGVALRPNRGLRTVEVAEYFTSHMLTNRDLLLNFRKSGTLHDIPMLDVSLGLRILTGLLIDTNWLAITSALRHWQGGAPANRWQVAMFNHNTTEMHKVRIGPAGPSDTILLPPSLFGHSEIPTKHGRGALEAMVVVDTWDYQKKELPKLGSVAPSAATVESYRHKLNAQHDRVKRQIEQEYDRLKAKPDANNPPKDPVAWFEQLSPFVDPTQKEHGDALYAAIAHLELMRINNENTLETDHALGWMYIDAGQGVNAQATATSLSLSGNFERATQIFAETRDILPPKEPQTSRYFELAVGEVTAQMHQAITNREVSPERIDTYCEQLAILAPQIIAAYETHADKTSAEAQALHYLIQLLTVCLAASYSTDKRAFALVSSPRQRGGINSTPRGWDFTMWVYDSPDVYLPGPFYGRIAAEDDFYSIDDGIVTFTPKRLGINSFKTIKSLTQAVNPTSNPGKPDYQAIKNTRQRLVAIAYSG